MGRDPQSPGYVPQYTGAPGNYGHGTEMGADLYALYFAGQLKIPTTAGHYSAAVTTLHWISGAFSGIAFDLGHPVVHRIVTAMRDLEDAMRLSTKRLYAAGDGLVQIADTYAATDQGARDEFAELLRRPDNAPLFQNPPGTHLPPEELDPTGEPPEDLPGSEDEIEEILQDAGIQDELGQSEDGEG